MRSVLFFFVCEKKRDHHRRTTKKVSETHEKSRYFTLFLLQVAVPIQGEQIYNAVRFVAKGFAVRLDIRTLTAEDLLVAITEVLENPVYARNIAKASEMFRSQLNHPLDVATHWIEHVIKYGDRHLRSHALDMPWYQYHMVDVFGALVGVFALSGFMLWVLLKLCRVRFLAVGVLVTVVIGVTVKLLL